MGQFLSLFNVSVAILLAAYFWYTFLLFEYQKFRTAYTATPGSKMSDDGQPKYSYAAHMVINPGSPTLIPFPSPSARPHDAAPMISRPFGDSTSRSQDGRSQAATSSTSRGASAGEKREASAVKREAKESRRTTRSQSVPLGLASEQRGAGGSGGGKEAADSDDDDKDSSSSDSSTSTIDVSSLARAVKPLSSNSRHSSPFPGAKADVPDSIAYHGYIRQTKTHDKTVTGWFESSSEAVLAEPPSDMLQHPKLQNGDVFVHVTPKKTQLWLFEEAGNGRTWKEIDLGYTRADGRTLLLSEKRGPSWVSQAYALRKLKPKGLLKKIS